MAQRTIYLKVLNEYIQGDQLTIGAAGSVQEVLLSLDFRGSDVWDGLARYVTFTDARGGEVPRILLTEYLRPAPEEDVYLVPVPAAALTYSGEITMTVTGYLLSDDSQQGAGKAKLRINTEAAVFRVLPNRFYGIPDREADLSEIEQLWGIVGTMRDVLYGNWLFLEVGEDGYLYELRIDEFPIAFALEEGVLEVTFA